MEPELDGSFYRELARERREAEALVMDRANRFEQHLAKLVETWREFHHAWMYKERKEHWLKSMNKEIYAAEKSLKELGVQDDA